MQTSIVQKAKKLAIASLFLLAIVSGYEVKAQKGYEFTSFTVIESIIPNGLGRSRIIHALETRDYKEFASVRSEDDNTRNKSDRDDIRVKNFEETKI